METESGGDTLRGWEREELWHRQTAWISVRGRAAASPVAEWHVCGYQCVLDVGGGVETVLSDYSGRPQKTMACPTFVKLVARWAACLARPVVHCGCVDRRFAL